MCENTFITAQCSLEALALGKYVDCAGEHLYPWKRSTPPWNIDHMTVGDHVIGNAATANRTKVTGNSPHVSRRLSYTPSNECVVG